MSNLPREGEPVLFCRHCDVEDGHHITLPDPAHWFFLDGAEVNRSDSSSLVVNWLVLCARCANRAGTKTRNVRAGTPVSYAARDARWIGDPPKIVGWA